MDNGPLSGGRENWQMEEEKFLVKEIASLIWVNSFRSDSLYSLCQVICRMIPVLTLYWVPPAIPKDRRGMQWVTDLKYFRKNLLRTLLLGL